MPIKNLFKSIEDYGRHAPRPQTQKDSCPAGTSRSSGSSVASAGGSSTVVCRAKTTNGTPCSVKGEYNGYCGHHWRSDPTGRAEAQWTAKNGPACCAVTQEGAKCAARGQYRGYCSQHRNKDPTGRAEAAWKSVNGPACRGTTQEGAKCINRGEFNGYCGVHRNKDASGRAEAEYDRKNGVKVAVAPRPADPNACRVITDKGTQCTRIGHYNGYCQQHAKKDPSGRATALVDQKKAAEPKAPAPAAVARPAAVSTGKCLGLTGKKTLCSNNGLYNGYCHHHVKQDPSGRAAKMYAAVKK